MQMQEVLSGRTAEWLQPCGGQLRTWWQDRQPRLTLASMQQPSSGLLMFMRCVVALYVPLTLESMSTKQVAFLQPEPCRNWGEYARPMRPLLDHATGSMGVQSRI